MMKDTEEEFQDAFEQHKIDPGLRTVIKIMTGKHTGTTVNRQPLTETCKQSLKKIEQDGKRFDDVRTASDRLGAIATWPQKTDQSKATQEPGVLGNEDHDNDDLENTAQAVASAEQPRT